MLPMLYGKDRKGNLQEWLISVEGADVVTHYGLVDGKKAESRYTAKPKNKGRANATTAEGQAQKEAQARWILQLKKGYAKSPDEIPQSKLPMLAMKYQNVKHNVTFPIPVLTKLDGVRCSAYLVDGEVFFQTRGGEAYPVIREIANELQSAFFDINSNYFVDFELYAHGLHLEDIVSAAKKHNKNTAQLEAHIFDLVDMSDNRYGWMQRYSKYTAISPRTSRVMPVLAGQVSNEDELLDMYVAAKLDGYEGVVLRDPSTPYEFGERTMGIVKYKEAESEEFVVTGMEQSKRGEGVLWCKCDKGEFKVNFKGTVDRRRELWDNQTAYIGKWLTVEFEAWSKYGKPLKPIGIAFREVDGSGEVMI